MKTNSKWTHATKCISETTPPPLRRKCKTNKRTVVTVKKRTYLRYHSPRKDTEPPTKIPQTTTLRVMDFF